MRKKTLVLGGDLRQLNMAQALGKEGFLIDLSGFDTQYLESIALPYRNMEDVCWREYEMIVLPLPVSRDEKVLNTPLFHGCIPLEQVFDKLSSDQVVVGGLFSRQLKQRFSSVGVKAWDYFDREELAIRNAVPTAEGAIAIAMDETPFTIHGSNCLVAGNGRIGRVLAKMLYGIGAQVTVSARKYEDVAWIETNSYHSLRTNEIAESAEQFDIIFNTIPHPVINGEVLRRVKKDCLIIDLASKPGGVDFECAKTLGLNTIWALSLPGVVAPRTAGIIIKDTIMNIRNELGV